MIDRRLKSRIGLLRKSGALIVAAMIGATVCAQPAARAANLECEIWTDSQNVSHARSWGEEGAVACLGYLHGRDRAWQMDYFRHAFQGRLAELYGKNAVVQDFQMRLLRLEDRAKELWSQMAPERKALFEAYTRGVNRGFVEGRDSYELRDLGHRLEAWESYQSLGVVLVQSLDQTRKTFGQELLENTSVARFGKAGAAAFSGDGLPWDVAVLKPGEFAERPAGAHVARPIPDPGFPGEGAEEGNGSNNWVVSSRRSAGGHAWLANDPHLQLTHPPFWYWSHIEGGRLNAIGASLPGVPVIVSGANTQVSWGLTNAYLDVGDIVAVPEEDLKDAQTIRPWVWVKLWKVKLPIFFKKFRLTRQGWPVLPSGGTIGEPPAGKAWVLRWSTFDLAARDFDGLYDLMLSRNAQEADLALQNVGVPSWNFVFADTSGNVGYRAVGKIPRRLAAPPLGAPAMGLEELARGWTYLTADEMPHVMNPAKGVLVTANNRQWPSDSALHGGRAYTAGFRAYRIEELLAQKQMHDLDSQKRTQCDVQSVDARFLLVPMLSVVKAQLAQGTSAERRAIAALGEWDFEANVGCVACGVYRRWVDVFLSENGMNEAALYRMLQEPATRQALSGQLVASFRQALADLDRAGRERSKDWGSLHQVRFAHLSKSPEKSEPDSPAWLPSPGDKHSVNPGVSDWRDDRYEHTSGASHRLIVEMTSPPKVYARLAGSNGDEARDPSRMALASSVWSKWRDCDYEQRQFPVDWTQLDTQTRRITIQE